MRKRVGIFGGSFNPPHNGHVEVCRYLLRNGDVDEIWVVPCFNHPYGKELAPFADRMAMCRFAFNEFRSKVRVSDAESKLGDISYTVDTVRHFQGINPYFKFYFIVGSDTLDDINMWKGSLELRSMIQFVSVPRGGDSPIPDISASNIRDCIKRGKKFTELVPKEVAIYIVTHGLYS